MQMNVLSLDVSVICRNFLSAVGEAFVQMLGAKPHEGIPS